MNDLKKHPIFVLWKREKRDGNTTKVPYQINNKYASSTNSDTWTTYAKVKEILDKKKRSPGKAGIGIVFEKSVGVIGIDFDNCVFDGIIDPTVEEFLKTADSYSEYSPSGTGIHVLFTSEESIDLLVNKHYFNDEDGPSVEIYTKGRYFTFTEDETEYSKAIRAVSEDAFIKLLKTLGYPWGKEKFESDPRSISNAKIQTGYAMDDSAILKRMFSSKNGATIKQLYNGDTGNHNNDHSSADLALCMHLAFWTQKNPQQIERMWMESPLGNRKKTQEREDYRARTIQRALDTTTETYTPAIMHVDDDAIDYDFILSGGKDPKPLMSYPNILRILRKNPRFIGMFRKNDFSHMTEARLDQDEWIPLNNDAILNVREYIAERFSAFHKVSTQMVTDAILRAAADNTVNPPKDYLESLEWDGEARLDNWLHTVYGVPTDEAHQAIGSNWLKGLVKRVIRPGCQFDEVLALESPQGWRKSTSIRVLGAPWHVETTHAIDGKDFYLLIAQNIIVEFSEGEIFDRNSVNKIKAEVTKTEDQVRPPYERGIMKFKRSCVFAVTTNKLELKDDTGNRRWLPVILEKPADVDWLKENRDQLFAEAYHRVVNKGETTYEYPKEMLETLQESRAEWSDYDEKTLFWVAEKDIEHLKEDGVSIHEAIYAAMGEHAEINKLKEMQMGGILRRTLHMEKKDKWYKGATVKRWFPTEKTIKIISKIETEQW